MTPANALAQLDAVPPVVVSGRERRLAAPAGLLAWRYTAYPSELAITDVVLIVNTGDDPVATGLVGHRLTSTLHSVPTRFDGTVLGNEIAIIEDQT